MIKFMVVLYKRADFTDGQFRGFFRDTHLSLALKLPGLRRHVVNFPAADPIRKPPAWNAIVELYFDSKEAMEEAWKSPEGEAATKDLATFADLTQSTWALVEEEATRL